MQRILKIGTVLLITINILALAGCSTLFGSTSARSSAPNLKTFYDDYLEKYNKIEKDMNYEDVEKLMGKSGVVLKDMTADEGTSTSQSANVPYPLNSYVWASNDDASSGIQVSVLFSTDGGSVYTKQFSGLAVNIIPQDARTTKDKFDKLSKGMTYDEAVSVLDSQGFMWQASKSYIGTAGTIETYAWWQNDNPTSMMTVMFQNGHAVVINK